MTIYEGVEYVDELMKAHRVTYGKDKLFRVDGETVPMAEVMDMLMFANSKLKDANFERAVRKWLSDHNRRELKTLQARLQYDGKSFNFSPLFKAVLEQWDELDEAVFKQVLWNVKRGLFDLKQDFEIMPIFMNYTQGSGKSTFAEKVFVTPFSPFSRQLQTLTELQDKFDVRNILSKNVVVYVDELAKGNSAVEVSALKKVLTQKIAESRVMFSEFSETVPKRAVIMGGANHSIADIIVDSTGMRRFWDFKCRARLDWDFVNNFDALPMWRSIDENGPAPILARLEEVYARQDQELRRPSGAETFIDERLELDDTARTPLKDLMQEFNSYCATFNYQRMSRHTLSSELKRQGIPFVNYGNVKHYKVKLKG